MKSRAERLNLTMSELCALADVRQDNISRWLRGISAPNTRTLARDARKLEAKLDAIEAEMLAYLSERVAADASAPSEQQACHGTS